MLRDKEIVDSINNGEVIIDPKIDISRWQEKDSLIQPASLDLRIGNIFLPGSERNIPGSFNNPRKNYPLPQGHTAVVETLENICLSDTIGAFGFPPSHVSALGILMTNPGHVDPGFKGKLRFTVINMGSEPYGLNSGQVIVSLLIFRLSQAAEFGYGKRSGAGMRPISEENLNRLSHDFVDVENRAKKEAEKATRIAGVKLSVVSVFAPLLVAALAVGVGSYFTTDIRNRLLALEKMMNYSLKMSDIGAIEERLEALELELSRNKGRNSEQAEGTVTIAPATRPGSDQ